MRFFRPCFVAGCLYPEALFRIKTNEKLLCITFDDGPDPNSTPLIIDVLDKYNIRGIFFCNGSAAEKYPDLIVSIKSRGHLIGNHGYNHADGWFTPNKKYVFDVLSAIPFTSDRLFRPPYGHIGFRQYLYLRKKFKIIFWDVMPYDFDEAFGLVQSMNVFKKKLRPGSIIVLHDTNSSLLPELLPELIDYSICKGYNFILPLIS